MEVGRSCGFILFFTSFSLFGASAQMPVSSLLMNDSPGKTWGTAKTSVFRIECAATRKKGTGFLHMSGDVITAAHVVAECPKAGLEIIDNTGKRFIATTRAIDSMVDLAAITPERKLPGLPLPVSRDESISLGTQVVAWGFPYGYSGLEPLLSVGHLAGADHVKVSEARTLRRFVINAAFNSGNSGGPLVDIESGNVVGVVSAKLAPIPKEVADKLHFLKDPHSSGPALNIGTMVFPDGTEKPYSQGELIADILYFLRLQTQLVIGYAVVTGDLREFLARNHLEPGDVKH